MTVVAFGPPPKNIARLSEFDMQDTQTTILYLAWQAREYLGDAERKEKEPLVVRTCWCLEAKTLLEASRDLLYRFGHEDRDDMLARSSRVATAADLLARARHAAAAAAENGSLAAKYEAEPSTGSAWDRAHAPKTISIFKRAAETARQETHRALVELCELFPEAMPTEER